MKDTVYYNQLISKFFDTAKNNQEKIAVREIDREITFSKLYCEVLFLSKKIEHLLKNKRNQRIGVFISKSIESTVADLAILLSGNVFVNLDTKNPVARLKSICDNCCLSIVIRKSASENVEQFFSGDVLDYCIDDIEKIDPYDFSLNNSIDDFLNRNYFKNVDTDPFCIINTSGSTGIPKAVALTHKGFCDFTNAAKKSKIIDGPEIIGSLSPAYFDIYVFELCLLMDSGSTIVIIPENLSLFPLKILQMLHDMSVTYIFWVPTIMVNIANKDFLSYVNLPSLKKVWFAGEVFPTVKFRYWADKLPKTQFVNMYGPIEIHVDCLFYIVPHDFPIDRPIPIGKPFYNTDAIILNDDNLITEPNEEGELCIRGSSLALGYFNDKKKTESVFVQNPLNKYYPELIYRTGDIVKLDGSGNYCFVGRKDTLVKRLGYRIELSEIEHVALAKIENIKNACVIFNEKTNDLIMYYESAEPIDNSLLKKNFMSLFPRYMVPTKYCHCRELLKNPNGKIDRNYYKNRE
ncbi:AMP-binding protein [Succinivibrio faecicola]|uniref:AMP-binding protein n=1 Tax=Succinivibrio faecicola TaxID=2820300 RepID=A0ABS7DHM5_9GAMM|nr:AMP-binding protein [Succinivibrio faecicola]MBW7570728.1 AMP-binding protein [Succinivibrio faecicola]